MPWLSTLKSTFQGCLIEEQGDSCKPEFKFPEYNIN